MVDITLVIGSKAHTTDNKVSGDVKCVVVDRSTLTVTHLVVEPRDGRARLVPLDHVDAPGGEIQLRYIEAEFKNLAAAEEIIGVWAIQLTGVGSCCGISARRGALPALDGRVPGLVRHR